MIEAVARCTISSATDDPRFAPVTADELPALTIHISALSPLVSIEPDAIELGRHGLVVVRGNRSGLLLPEVPLHLGLRTPGEFLAALYRKAGIAGGPPIQHGDQLLAFESETWCDDVPAPPDDGEKAARQ